MVFFFIFALNLTIALPKRVFFLYYCPNSNQSPARNGPFLSFCLILTKVVQQRAFYCIFDPYSNQSPAIQGVFSSTFALILIKAIPKRGFSLLLPVSKVAKIRNRYNQVPSTKLSAQA